MLPSVVEHGHLLICPRSVQGGAENTYDIPVSLILMAFESPRV